MVSRGCLVQGCSQRCFIHWGYWLAQSKTTGTSLQVTTNAAAQAGDTIIVTFATDISANIATVTDSASPSNNYTEVNDSYNSGHVRTTTFVALNVNALPVGGTITISHDSLTARAAVVSDFRGILPTSAIDQATTATGTNSTPSSGATGTTSQASELLIGSVGIEGGNYDQIGSWENSFTSGPRLGTNAGTTTTDATDITANHAWKIVNATGAYTATRGGITSRSWAASIVTLKAAPICYALTLSHTGSGSDPVASPTNSSGCLSGQYVAGASISLSGAVPATYYVINGWTGTSGDSSTANTNSLTMPANATTVYVNYTYVAPTCYALTLNHTGNGSDPVASPTKSSPCSTNGTLWLGKASA